MTCRVISTNNLRLFFWLLLLAFVIVDFPLLNFWEGFPRAIFKIPLYYFQAWLSWKFLYDNSLELHHEFFSDVNEVVRTAKKAGLGKSKKRSSEENGEEGEGGSV